MALGRKNSGKQLTGHLKTLYARLGGELRWIENPPKLRQRKWRGGDAFAAAHLTAAGRWAPHAAAAHASRRGASGSAHHTATSSAWPMFRRTVAVGTSGGAVAEAACDDQAREDASAEEGLFSL